MKKIILAMAVMLLSVNAFSSTSAASYVEVAVPAEGCTVELLDGIADAVNSIMLEVDGENHFGGSYNHVSVYVDTTNGNKVYLQVAPGWTGKPEMFTVYIYDLSYTYTINVTLTPDK